MRRVVERKTPDGTSQRHPEDQECTHTIVYNQRLIWIIECGKILYVLIILIRISGCHSWSCLCAACDVSSVFLYSLIERECFILSLLGECELRCYFDGIM